MSMFDIPRAEKISKQLTDAFNSIREGKRNSDLYEREELRASNFPVCPKAYVIYRRSPLGKRPRKKETFMSETATLLGTSLHLVLQKWFGLEGQLHGNWVCVHCKKIRRHRTGMQVCKKCGREMTYHEYDVKPGPKTPFSGHIDGILIVPHDGNYLIDFKGSSQFKIRGLKNDNRPKEEHYLQANAYAHAVNMNLDAYGLTEKIQKIIILYVDRGEPWRTWLPLQVPLSRQLYQDSIGRIQLAKECLKTGRIPKGLCVSPEDYHAKWCPWKVVCFSPVLKGLLSDAVESEGKSGGRSEQELLAVASYFESL